MNGCFTDDYAEAREKSLGAAKWGLGGNLGTHGSCVCHIGCSHDDANDGGDVVARRIRSGAVSI
jgi:hypothetical protein